MVFGERPGFSGFTSKPDRGQITVVGLRGAFLTGSALVAAAFFAGAAFLAGPPS